MVQQFQAVQDGGSHHVSMEVSLLGDMTKDTTPATVENARNGIRQIVARLCPEPAKRTLESVVTNCVETLHRRSALLAFSSLVKYFRAPASIGVENTGVENEARDAFWPRDVFPAPNTNITAADPEESLSLEDNIDWLILIAGSLALILFEMLALRRISNTWFNHLAIVVLWVTVACIYCLFLGFEHDKSMAIEWLLGYILEWVLSVDNLFIFHIVIDAFRTPPALIHKALFLGVIGAIFFRVVLFFAMKHLLDAITPVRFIFGVMLIYAGCQAVAENDDDSAKKPSDMYVVRLLKKCLGSRLRDSFDEEEQCIFVLGKDGQLQVTLLLPLVCCIELTDLIFAVDSLTSKIAVMPDVFMCVSSSVLAIFGLRAAFFVLRDAVEHFEFLKYGICIILVFIGCEIILAPWIELPPTTLLLIILAVLVVAIAATLLKRRTTLGDRDASSEAQPT